MAQVREPDASVSSPPVSAPPPPMRHVVFIGETGAGKSSVINLFADRECAQTSSDAAPCTREFVSCDVLVDGTTYRLWDTPGLNDPSGFGVFLRRSTTFSSLKRFLRERHHRGELDLLVFCVRGNRATEGMARAYKIFGHPTRQFAIPVVIAITHLERKQPAMETWWQENERSLGNLGLRFDGYACLTCLSPHNRSDTTGVLSIEQGILGRYRQSLRDMLTVHDGR